MADAVAGVASVKTLQSDMPRGHTTVSGAGIAMGETNEKPFAGIVCLALDGNSESVFDSYLAANMQLARANRANVPLVIDEFVAVWTSGTGVILEPSPLAAAFLVRWPIRETALLVFYVMLREALRRYQPPPLDFTRYANAGSGVGDVPMDAAVIGTR